MNWSTEILGVRISNEIAIELENSWANFSTEYVAADEIDLEETFVESESKSVLVNILHRRKPPLTTYGGF